MANAREARGPYFPFPFSRLSEKMRGSESGGRTWPLSRAATGRANYLHSTYICISALPGGLPTQLLLFCALSYSSTIHFQHPELAFSASPTPKSFPRGALEEAAISVSEMRRQKKSDSRIYSGLSGRLHYICIYIYIHVNTDVGLSSLLIPHCTLYNLLPLPLGFAGQGAPLLVSAL